MFDQDAGQLTDQVTAVSFFMKTISKTLLLGLTAGALCLTSCETVENRISEHQDMFNTLSPRDQALVRQGQIRSGMSMNAVWLAWGSQHKKLTAKCAAAKPKPGFMWKVGRHRTAQRITLTMVTVQDFTAASARSVWFGRTTTDARSFSLGIRSTTLFITPTFRRRFQSHTGQSRFQADA